MPKSTLTGVSWASDVVPAPADPDLSVVEPVVVDEHGDDAAAVAGEPAAEKPSRRRAR